jgi:ABC-type branched-subunit amino acid transport system substrate-binding protein
VIRIGALAPLSPPGWVSAGRHLLAGLELGVAEVNAGGGERLELLVRDTAADPQRAVAAVDELSALGVNALAGEYHSVVAKAVAARADELRLPFLCSSAVLDALTDHPANWVARIAPPQSRGWTVFAEFLKSEGHSKIAVVFQPSAYWAAGIRILKDHLTVTELAATPAAAHPDARGGAGADALIDVRAGALGDATAVLLLVGHPEPGLSLARQIRNTGSIRIAAPAGQPEFNGLPGIPFLRYLPEHLSPRGTRVEAALHQRLGEKPSFVAFEGYDTILALADLLRSNNGDWARVAVEGSRGPIHFSRSPSVWQWDNAPIQVVERDPERPEEIKVLLSR